MSTTTTAVKERPILFSSAMVRALLSGAKTQTRRIVRWKSPEPGLNLAFSGLSAGHYFTDLPSSGHVLYSRRGDGVWEQRTKPTFCPHGQPGDRLWVRETWMPRALDLPISRIMRPRYRADEGGDRPEWRGLWRPSIHMPRWASRITLEVTGVRVERVQEISEEDAIAEGVGPGYVPNSLGSTTCVGHRPMFRRLWDEINGKRPGCSWADNPWVWAIEFWRVAP